MGAIVFNSMDFTGTFLLTLWSITFPFYRWERQSSRTPDDLPFPTAAKKAVEVILKEFFFFTLGET